ncbi:hypothetical protein NPIL_69731 [Nephila pilipes]|uniref:Uncharacterized protein n=1 Tax=Nephila pilipes TaxID=299642 RepID=A0A8X6UD42_NEPPI|nr:hypothetical protein NPIL_69731 [Nephila pilipes]
MEICWSSFYVRHSDSVFLHETFSPKESLQEDSTQLWKYRIYESSLPRKMLITLPIKEKTMLAAAPAYTCRS